MNKSIVVSMAVVFLVAASADYSEAKSCKSKKIKASVGGVGVMASDAIQLWYFKVTAKYGPAYSQFGNAKSRSSKCKTVSGAGVPVRKCTAKGRPCRK